MTEPLDNNLRPPAGSLSRLVLPALCGIAAIVACIFLFRHATPDRYVLRMVQPQVEYRRELAKLLAEHAARQGVQIELVEADDELSAINAVVEGRADLCFAADQLQSPPEIGEIVELSREVLHVLVRPELVPAGLEGLRGKRVSMGRPGTDSYRVAEQVLRFAGMDAKGMVTIVHADPREIQKSADMTTLPDAVLLLSEPQSPVARGLATTCGYVPLPLPFGEALAQRDPALRTSFLPPYLYSVNPALPAADIPCVQTATRLVAHRDLPVKAVRRVIDAVFDGAFAHRGNLPHLDSESPGTPGAFALHPGTIAYLHRNDPLITSDLIMATDDLRNLAVSLVVGSVLFWQWWRRRRSVGLHSAVHRVNQLEHEALTLEMVTSLDVVRTNHIRRTLAHEKATAIERFGKSGGLADKPVAELLRRVDDLRHYLLGLLAHHHQTRSSGKGDHETSSIIGDDARQASDEENAEACYAR